MSNRILIAVGGLIAALIGIFILLTLPDGGMVDDATEDTDQRQQGDANEGDAALTQRYTSGELDFSIRHEADAEISVEGPGNRYIKFLKTGPTQEPDTEVQDGYILTVGVYDTDDHASLAALAEERAASVQNVGEVLDPVTETRFKGVDALRFRSQSIGAPTSHVLVASPNWYYQLSYSVVGPEVARYQTVVDAMLDSFIATGGLLGSGSDLPVYESVQIAVLDRDVTDEDDIDRGCDRVVMVPRSITPTTAPLTAAMEELFAIDTEEVTSDNWFNFMARTNSTLAFDRATVVNGTAGIYLTGELSGLAGVCDNPRAAIQIEETALQFGTVDTVEIYLNDELTDLTPDGQGT